MLAVIGLEVCSASIVDIDALDYLIYNNQNITFNQDPSRTLLIKQCQAVIDKLLAVNHLQPSEVSLVFLDESSQLIPELFCEQFSGFSSKNITHSLVDALTTSLQLSQVTKLASVVVCINQHQLDGASGLLVCDKKLTQLQTSQLSFCHVYAEIDAVKLVSEATSDLAKNIGHFISSNQLKLKTVESMLINQVATNLTELSIKQEQQALHENACLTAFENIEDKLHCQLPKGDLPAKPASDKSTLLVCMNNIEQGSDNFTMMLSLFASILCLDQHYRLASQLQALETETDLQARWQKSTFYCLSKATSYLTGKNVSKRKLVVSLLNDETQQLLLLSKETTKTSTKMLANGFLAQQANKPVIFKAPCIQSLQQILQQTLQECLCTLNTVQDNSILFNQFCKKQNLISNSINENVYCLVLIANNVKTLIEQIKVALPSISTALQDNNPWKTPNGSYFSGLLIEPNDANTKKPISFIYPGVGALYVGMGRDLLRLFPSVYQSLTKVSDDLAFSLQDKLMAPRSISVIDTTQQVKYENLLRNKLVNIAEAGVSYSCLLTSIFQQQLNINATSAAGYSMGEVSMFAALGCWENPQTMSSRLRKSPIFTDKLAGPLTRLDTFHKKQLDAKWESYHLKTTVAKVQAILNNFPFVYITIINTQQSLVIAGFPEQCLLLAKQLKVRAVPLKVHNIIHCELAKSEYENMKQLYSLPVTRKQQCQLYSSSCYLPIPITKKAIAVSVSKCLTEQVDFPRLIRKIANSGETVFVEMGAGKSLSTWIDKILKNNKTAVTCLSVDQKNTDDYQAILKTIAPLISLGYRINLQSFFSGTLIRPVQKMPAPISVF